MGLRRNVYGMWNEIVLKLWNKLKTRLADSPTPSPQSDLSYSINVAGKTILMYPSVLSLVVASTSHCLATTILLHRDMAGS
jgi:hypothetical protein